MGRIRELLRPRAGVDWNAPGVWTQLGGGSILGGGGRQTMAGETVSPDKALTLPAYLACIKNKSEDIAGLPWNVYRPSETGRGRVKADESRVWTLLHDEANPEMSSFTFRELMVSWALGWGLGVAEIVREGNEPVALWPIHPSRIWIRRVAGEVVYFVRNEADPQNPTPLRMMDVFTLHGLGPDGLIGYSLAQLMAETIGMGLAAQTYGAAVFGNDATLGVVFTAPNELSETGYNRMKASLMEQRAGARHAFKPFLADGGVKVERMSIPPKDAQMVESQKFTIEEMARGARIPLNMIGVSQPYASIEQLGIEYAKFCITPWCVRLEREAKRKLLRDRRGWSSELLLQSLMRGDYAGRVAGYSTQIMAGQLKPNEARELEGHEPDDTPGADDLWMQGAMVRMGTLAAGPAPVASEPVAAAPVEEEPEPDEPEPVEPEPEADDAPEPEGEPMAMAGVTSPETASRVDVLASLRPVFMDTAGRCVRRETMAASNAMRRNLEDVGAFQRWARKFYEAERVLLVSAFSPVCESAGADPASWLMEEAHDAAMEAGRLALQSFADASVMPDEEPRVVALADRMMNRAMRALESKP